MQSESQNSPGHPETAAGMEAVSGLASPGAGARYETLTAWRGVACLMVVIYHSLFTGYGLAFPEGPGLLGGLLEVLRRFWLGVPLFFVISGYCISASADAARRRDRPAGEFFWRRFRRIYPVYWAWILPVAVGVWLTERMSPGFFQRAFVPDPNNFTVWQWLGNVTLTETWRWHLTGGTESFLLSPAWTLCYEEQFYAIVGLTLLIARRYMFGVLGLISVAVLAGLFVFPWLGLPTMGLFVDGRWLMFAAGVLVYYTINYAPRRAWLWAYAVLGLGVLCAVSTPERLLAREVNEPNQSYLLAFAFAILLLPLHRYDIRIGTAWWARPLTFCGEMCYSLYLVHWPVVTLVGWAFNQLGLSNPLIVFGAGLGCCLSVAIGVARVFHWTVERRFWNPPERSAKEKPSPDKH